MAATPKFMMPKLTDDQQRDLVKSFVDMLKPYCDLVELASANRGNRSDRLSNWIESVETAPLSFNINALYEGDDLDEFFIFDWNAVEDETEIKSALLFIETVRDVLTDRLNALAYSALAPAVDTSKLDELPAMKTEIDSHWAGLKMFVAAGQISRDIFVKEMGDFIKTGQNKGRGTDLDTLNIPKVPRRRLSSKSTKMRLVVNDELITTVTINGKEFTARELPLSQVIFGTLGISFDTFAKVLDGGFDVDMDAIEMPAPKLAPADFVATKEKPVYTVMAKIREV